MKRILIFIIFVNLYNITNAQWYWQNPLPQGNNLNSVEFVSSYIGWVVGDYGTILKTTDGGASWIFQNTEISASLKSVCFIDQNIGWIVGNDSLLSGIVLKTTDGGSNWIIQFKDTSIFSSVDFEDNNYGWVAGVAPNGNANAFFTTDGGENWISSFTAPINNIISVEFINDKIGFIAGYYQYWVAMDGYYYDGYVYKTTDGGVTWDSADNNFLKIISMNFVNDLTGWIVNAYGQVFQTIDCGLSWFKLDNKVDETWCGAAYFIDNKNGCAFGFGKHARSSDGGENWELSENKIVVGVNSIVFIDQSIGWAVGDNGTILKTIDGGNTWHGQPRGIREGIESIYFIDENIGWAVGGENIKNDESIILWTTDGGLNWNKSQNTISTIIRSVSFLNEDLGWMCGDNGIYKTTNGGKNWKQLPVSRSSGYSICAVNENYIIAVGPSGSYITEDGGITWMHGFSDKYNCVFFFDKQYGWIVGDGGKVFRVYSSGIEVLPVNLTAEDLYSVFFIDKDIGWTVGSGGIIMKTTDRGRSWEIQNCNSSDYLRSVCFSDNNNGWIVGDNGNIFKTTDGGNNWYKQRYVTSNKLKTVFFYDENTGWIGGDGGSILHTTTGGVTFFNEGNEIIQPQEFSLSQNYPNPFNPTTTIKYSIAQAVFPSWEGNGRGGSQNVTLKIFDLLGREVLTLVNEEKPAGSYEVQINASELSTGVYFYQLCAGGFVQTKKMILLR